MAARRLILILIALMVVSTLAAALAPVREDSGDNSDATTTTEPATGPDSDPQPTGGLLEARLPPVDKSAKPREIELDPGERLSLTVAVAEPAEVEIPRLGLTAFAEPLDPARFDILLADQPSATVRVGPDGEIAGRIVAKQAKAG